MDILVYQSLYVLSLYLMDNFHFSFMTKKEENHIKNQNIFHINVYLIYKSSTSCKLSVSIESVHTDTSESMVTAVVGVNSAGVVVAVVVVVDNVVIAVFVVVTCKNCCAVDIEFKPFIFPFMLFVSLKLDVGICRCRIIAKRCCVNSK